KRLRKLRYYGEGERYVHDTDGFNSRLDELQAAILRAKLPLLERWTGDRRSRAVRYAQLLGRLPIHLPAEQNNARHCYHLYVIRSDQRDALQAHLKSAGIGTLLHYPLPIHLQPAYRRLGYSAGAFPVAEAACRQVLSLPLYPELPMASIEIVSDAINAFFANT
ncbi:MAG: DegT/DnrJ/EryC1/StrS family aminotransferase, partial [Candidatus Hydrogenedentales bacterium]